MNERGHGGLVSLPLVTGEGTPSAPAWRGLRPLEEPPLPIREAGAEPLAPQGAYGPGEAEAVLVLPDTPGEAARGPVELLAPAGNLDAAFAAFHFGADAIYLGLKKFSARAEADNFTLEEVEEIVAYAHALQPRRRVFVTINTVLRQDELPELLEVLAALEDLGADAVILQDLGVFRAIRRYFPGLELHGSTQMAVHDGAGTATLARLGFRRVVLARELTLEEVRDVTGQAGVETEVFIHGALCYSYSGLCLFSSQTLGRSGNRGRCAYSCRDSYEVEGAPLTLRDGSPVKRDPRTGFPFSMKDLALPDHLPVLRASGVSCFKIEGRKKSPLYVATTTDYYRRLLDAKLRAEERPALEADLQTVFSRPWTKLFVQSHKDKEVADRDTVGHRGTPVGRVEAVLDGHGPRARLRFRTARAIQRHDGLQVDLPVLGKPFGFPVDRLGMMEGRRGRPRDVLQAPAGALVEVGLPEDHPHLAVGAPVYCSSSQEVKQRYRYHRPKPGSYRLERPVRIRATLTAESLTVEAATDLGGETLRCWEELPGPFEQARVAGTSRQALEGAFARLGSVPFRLESLDLDDPDGLFVPVSRLNALRRDLLNRLAEAVRGHQQQRLATIRAEVLPSPAPRDPTTAFAWSLKVDRLNFLADFAAEDWEQVDEVIVDLARDHPATLKEGLAALGEKIGRERIRLALPPLTRAWEEKGLRHKIASLRAAGWRKWEAANLSAWTYLGLDPATTTTGDLDLAADWSIYVVNRLAALQVLEMGATRFALSPEDGLANMRSLLAEFGPRAVVIVHQDTPQFLAESCAYANLIGGCPGKANCSFESMHMVSSHGERVLALDYHCRTIVLNEGPYCLSTRLPDLARAGAVSLRADFIYRPYDPREVRTRWRRIRAGQPIAGGHPANFERGIL